MKTKIILSIIFGILLLSLTFAQLGLKKTDSSLDATQEQKDGLKSIGITNPTRSQMICDGEKCRVHLYQANAIDKDVEIDQTHTIATKLDENNETIESEEVPYSDAELEDSMNNAIKGLLLSIADYQAGKNAADQEKKSKEEVKLDSGVISISDAKADVLK